MAKIRDGPSRDVGPVLWKRADLKWHCYPPRPEVKTLAAFFQLVDGDESGCLGGSVLGMALLHPIAAPIRREYLACRLTPIMSYLVPLWRSFCTLDSHSEAACVADCCSYSFATLEVAGCDPGNAIFALTEQRQIDAWRWAICSNNGLILQAGSEPTQTGAKRVAEEALRLKEA